MDVKIVIASIVQHRKRKGFTYENMADELSITVSAYRKIETAETRLTVERLFRISKFLDVSIGELLQLDSPAFIVDKNKSPDLDAIHHYNKVIVEQLIKSKDQVIEVLQNEVEFLRKTTS